MPSLQTQADKARAHLKAAYDDAHKRKSRNGKKSRQPRRLLMERNTVVLWGMYHGWPDTQIGEYFFLNTSTVLRLAGGLARTRSPSSKYLSSV